MSVSRLFDPKVKRIPEEMKSSLQQVSVGNWFMRNEHSVIRVYGFTGAPFILPLFFTSTKFSLELTR